MLFMVFEKGLKKAKYHELSNLLKGGKRAALGTIHNGMKKIAIFILLLIVGCATVPIPTQEQMDNADYGSSPSDYQ